MRLRRSSSPVQITTVAGKSVDLSFLLSPASVPNICWILVLEIARCGRQSLVCRVGEA
jgi:hypothetical protein